MLWVIILPDEGRNDSLSVFKSRLWNPSHAPRERSRREGAGELGSTNRLRSRTSCPQATKKFSNFFPNPRKNP